MDVESAQTLTENTIYMLGGSFILGSLFTIFVLLVLDGIRASKKKKEES